MNTNTERNMLRKKQSLVVIPLIGRLLDAWDDLPNDVKSDPELERVAKHIRLIDEGMEGEHE